MTNLILRYWWLIAIVLIILKRSQKKPNIIKIGYKGEHLKFINDVINRYSTSSKLDENIFSDWNSNFLYDLIVRDSKKNGKDYLNGSYLKLDNTPQVIWTFNTHSGEWIADGLVLEFDIDWLKSRYAVI